MPSIEPFNKFDAAAAEEFARPAPADFSESLKRVAALVDELPQRAVIEDSHAERWINRTMEMAIQRMELEHGEGKATVENVHDHVMWHVRRASAIGGSEIGTIVRHFRGEKGGFTNARNLALEKLLIMAPQPGDEAMNRGVRAEPWIQRMFLEEHDAVSDEGALDILKGFRWEEAPQIVGTPDDLIIHPGEVRRIHDYKAPSADVIAEYEKKGMVSFDYVCQVHQYGIFAREAGIDFEGMEIDCLDPRSFTVMRFEIPYDTDLEAEMIEGADTFWFEFVMKGLLPEVPGLGQLKTEDEEYADKFHELGVQGAALKLIAEEVTRRHKEVLDRVRSLQRDAHDLDEGKIDVEIATFERRRAWNEDMLLQLAEAAGVDDGEFRDVTKDFDKDQGEAMLKQVIEAGEEDITSLPNLVDDMIRAGGVPYKRKLNAERLVAHLKELGVDVTPAAEIAEKFSISRAKVNADKVGLVKTKAIELADIVEKVVEDNTDDFIAGRVEDDLDEVEM